MVKEIISTHNVSYTYESHLEDRPDVQALHGVSIHIPQGQFLVVLGRNGSGKSTFARLLNGLQLPTEGTVYIKNMDTHDEKHIWEIRRSCGMVFQNPDNQIVGTIVEEDVAFGPENLGIPSEKIRLWVDEALGIVGMKEYAKHGPHLLSGGQKQRVAIAGILAMKPECILLDEATSMLDPSGRNEVMSILRKLNKEHNLTVVHITHHMDEASIADRVIVINEGRVVCDGSPKEVFSQVEKVKKLGLDVPQITDLFYELRKQGLALPDDVITEEDAYLAMETLLMGNI